jgi:hypothetical protein
MRMTWPAYLVRVIFGAKPEVFPLRMRVSHQEWNFENGIAVVDQSLKYALYRAQRRMGTKGNEQSRSDSCT